MLKTQQRFRSEKHNLFMEEINKIALYAKMDFLLYRKILH